MKKTQRIGWKMARMGNNDVILKLEILGRVVTGFRRFQSGTNIQFNHCDKNGVRSAGTKRRTSKVRVLEVYSTRDDSYTRGRGRSISRISRKLKNYGTITSYHDSNFRYEVGKIATPQYPLNTDATKGCGSGIHFFDTKREALMYQMYRG